MQSSEELPPLGGGDLCQRGSVSAATEGAAVLIFGPFGYEEGEMEQQSKPQAKYRQAKLDPILLPAPHFLLVVLEAKTL